ncbi:MAG: hypothetical protein KKA73_25845 [Chloroflexi bacterium]|nr:hypothetical protein [Chloroflexota bacterium]
MVFNLPPIDLVSWVLFLVVLFVALTSTLAFPAYAVGCWLHRRWPAVRSGAPVAVRQGGLIALVVVVVVVVVCAVLHTSRALTLGHVVLIFFTLLIVEVFWQVHRD